MTTYNDSDTPAVSNKGIWGWMFFDWAAQPFFTLLLTFFFARYFATGVVGDGATAQSLWGLMLTVSGITIALLSPILGSVADATGPRKPWIAGFMLLAVLGAAALWWAVPNAPYSTIVLTLVAFGIAMIGVEFSTVFNNAMMPDLVPRERLGRLSGSAWALGYVGGVVALVIVLVFMASVTPGARTTIAGLTPIFGLADIPGGSDRATGLLTAVWMSVFVIPLFLFTPDTPKRVHVQGAVSKGLSELKQTIINLPKQRSLFAYLGSSMFYRDALNGLYGFGGIYAGGVLEWSATKLGIFGILTALAGAIGAWLGGRLDDRFGPKSVVTVSILMLILASVIIVTTDKNMVLLTQVVVDQNAAFSVPDIAFYICGVIIGAFGGALQAASRTLLTDQADPKKMGEAFGLYALSGKATSFMAPALIGAITAWALTSGFASSDAQRIGITPVVILFVIGLVLLPFVKQRTAPPN